MKTLITAPFIFASPSLVFIQSALSAAGINDIVISCIESGDCTLTITANRYLTDAEKGAVALAFVAKIIRVEDI